MEIPRKQFLETLLMFKDQDVIKVLTGIRRCGKSTLLRQYIEILKRSGISDDRIVYINMESLSNARFSDGMVLYREITEKNNREKIYIFLDEVQYIGGWERTVNSFRTDLDCDIYVTGSNAYLLSTDISTRLTGRSIPIAVLPFSFSEYCVLNRPGSVADMMRIFGRYVTLGGFPFIRPEMPEEAILQRLDEIKSDIILKDICMRREKTDSVKIRRAVDYMFSEIGNAVSPEKMASALNISQSTAGDYLRLITESLLFIKIERYDLRGRSILKTRGKYYCTDLGMRNTRPLPADRDYGRILENIVCLELIRRGFRVYIGKAGNYEIDFIARKGTETEFYQISHSVSDPEVLERKLRPFGNLKSQGRRFLITSDPAAGIQTDEVTVTNIIDFLTRRSGYVR